jgi:UDP-N-acetylmuramoyl-L-alanyl-D-glutamate--2,6-diaminopimelate ligase
MKLSDILRGLDYRVLQGDPEVEIRELCYDSRRVRESSAFIAIKGFKVDGHDFIPQALDNGATAVIVEKETDLPLGVTGVIVKDTREALGLLGANFYNHPSQSLGVIGVVGTNGKTTSTYLVRSILMAAGHKVGVMGTIKSLIGDVEIATERTTPEGLDLQELLARMAEQGVDHAIMEVSSHAIALKRTAGCDFKGGIFTNITQDHLDFHGTFQEYLNVKARFFKELDPLAEGSKVAAINIDDPYGTYMEQVCSAHVVTYGIRGDAMVKARDVNVTYRGTTFILESPWGSREIQLKLTGPFNVYNALGAASLCLKLGVDIDNVKAGLEGIEGVAGRFEAVDCGQDFAVIVDYAHTPDGLRNVLSTARSFLQGRLICVFGCGGDRDKTKRPIMGEISGQLSDYTIITSDNPRTEEPFSIMRHIEEGIVGTGGKYHMEVDRKKAIGDAIAMARSGDVIIIAGKGHENYQIFKDKTIHFDDREAAEEILTALKEGGAHSPR